MHLINLRYCHIVIFLAPIALFISCKKDPAIVEINNLNGNQISVFGHAGMGLEFKYPIDTYESVEPVLRIGADGCEIDIQMTSDSVIVLYHNTNLEEMTLCTSGMVNDKTWPDIWGCHIASPYSSKIKLISFEELVKALIVSGKNIHDYIFTFDCKLYSTKEPRNSFYHQFANAIIRLIEKYDLAQHHFIESQNIDFLAILKSKDPNLKLFIYPSNFDSGMKKAEQLDLYGITISNTEITAEQVKLAHEAGKRITLWGLQTVKDNQEAIEKSPDFVQTDKPIHLLKVFGKYSE